MSDAKRCDARNCTNRADRFVFFYCSRCDRRVGETLNLCEIHFAESDDDYCWCFGKILMVDSSEQWSIDDWLSDGVPDAAYD